jgi:hypothetical protein
MTCGFTRHTTSGTPVCTHPDARYTVICRPDDCEAEFAEWGAWRAGIGQLERYDNGHFGWHRQPSLARRDVGGHPRIVFLAAGWSP